MFNLSKVNIDGGNFLIVVSLLYNTHYPIFFLFILPEANKQEEILIYKYGFDTFIDRAFTSYSSCGVWLYNNS